MSDLIKSVDAPINPNIPDLRPGDTVSVHVKIKEGARERIQEFRGTVLYIHQNKAKNVCFPTSLIFRTIMKIRLSSWVRM